METLANIAAAAKGVPVTHKTLTVTGAVKNPITLTVPIGMRFSELIELAGGATTPDPVLCLGGLMMGETTDKLDRPVTKTTTGIVVLPRSHPVVMRKLKPAQNQARIGKSACDQCRFCTEYCPRYLLGYAVEPHQVMRTLGFANGEADRWNQLASYCCSCGLCTLFACPEQLFPKEACDGAKAQMKKQNIKPVAPAKLEVHPMRDGRRVPVKSLTRRLQVQAYDLPAPWFEGAVKPKQLFLQLKQSAGAPCQAIVQAGDRVQAGQQIGKVPDNALGAVLHTPLAGVVTEVTPERILLQIS